MAEISFSEGLALLESRTRWGTVAIWAVIVAGLLTGLFEFMEVGGAIDISKAGQGGLATVAAFIYLAFPVFFVISAVFVSLWIYRAHANLFTAGLDDLEYPPGWSVGWFFVPFANLVKPFHAMRELWNASHGTDDLYNAETPGSVGTWWTCFIIGNILSNIGARVEGGDYDADGKAIGVLMSGIGTLLIVASAWFLLKVVREVMEGQRNHLQVSEAFA